MKVCRFELLEHPDEIRSGIVRSGKVYETDGGNAVAVHEADAIRPLAPVGRPPSLRILRGDPGDVEYFYGNPNCVIGPSRIVTTPDFTNRLDYEPYLAAVILQDCQNVPIEDADLVILGISMVNLLVARDVPGTARSMDFAAALGPVLTTPEELDDKVEDESRGRQYQLSVVTRVNGVEKRRGDAVDLPYTFAEFISRASEGCPLREGDLFLMGPLAVAEEGDLGLSPGDEVQVSVEMLGTLATKVAL